MITKIPSVVNFRELLHAIELFICFKNISINFGISQDENTHFWQFPRTKFM